MFKYFLLFLIILFVGPLIVFLTHQVDFSTDWRTAPRLSAGISPKVDEFKPAVVEFFSARTYHWRGLFAVHTWIAIKPKNASSYTVYQVIGWRQWMGLPLLSISEDIPDRFWFGAKPTLLKELRGEEAEKVIPKIEKAIQDYPFKNTYNYWPGPNSNTFPAFIARAVPEMKLALPAMAVGKDYLGTQIFVRAPSGTGYQISFLGVLGLMIAKEEGLEINFLGMVFGINFKHLAIILPGLGEVGLKIK